MGLYREKIFPLLERVATGGVKRVRQRLVAEATGVTLEIGAGAGQNFAYLPQGLPRCFAIEPHPTFLTLLRRKLVADAGPNGIHLCRAVAEGLPLKPNSVDTVVTFLVLCSVHNPLQSLKEISRVLKPGGRLLFFEHVYSYEPAVARRQRFWDPIWRRVACGCRLTRDTQTLIQNAGLSYKTIRRYRCPGMGPAITSCVIEGMAVKTDRCL